MSKTRSSQIIHWLTLCVFLFVTPFVQGAQDTSTILQNEDYLRAPNEVAASASVPWQVPIPLHRYYNAQSKNHAYKTLKTNESDAQMEAWGYKYEGVLGKVYKNPATGTVALHRYYHGINVDHFYTTNWGRLGGGQESYKYEGIECYVYPNPAEGLVPLFRYWSPTAKDHFYTTDWNEIRDEGKSYKIQNIEAYIFPNN